MTHHRAGSLATGPWGLELTPDVAGWGYSSLRVLVLDAGATSTFATGDDEMALLPLTGGCTVECDGEAFTLTGRPSVFAGVSDFVYVPRDAGVTVRATAGPVRLALPAARCSRRLEPRYTPAAGVPVELRGAGSCSRQVNNFCAAGVFEADRLIAVEVLTPGGNWSSYPPHKHDEEHPGVESELEEIYYFEVDAPEGAEGMAYQRVYGTEDRPADVLAEVRTGDVVCMPHGWHGPSMAVPGYDLYYLNVMAGPSPDRAWLIRDDPAHAWIREIWRDQPVDPRLPLTSAEGAAHD
ncbi:MAG: 5-deoxy-glucuronate isomerase [Streptosporangiales bacterium]|nr:5-deoxy-glucuronate isomerase [Streptosporangiales bacterium]